MQVLGVSVDTPFSLKAWAEQEGYQFPLLSDFWPHGEVAQAYGVFNDKAGMALRGTFLIDTRGRRPVRRGQRSPARPATRTAGRRPSPNWLVIAAAPVPDRRRAPGA